MFAIKEPTINAQYAYFLLQFYFTFIAVVQCGQLGSCSQAALLTVTSRNITHLMHDNIKPIIHTHIVSSHKASYPRRSHSKNYNV